MTISSSLNAGVMGLSVNATKLAAISDNVANSGTVGYKRATADFFSMVLADNPAAFAAGGVRVETARLAGEQGALFSTGRSTDIALAGKGFLPTTQDINIFDQPGERPLILTATGSFRSDERGFLVTPGGAALLGWPANPDGSVGNVSRRSGIDLVPVNINTTELAAEPTTQVGLGINLPAGATGAGESGDPYTLPIEAFDNLGRVQTINAVFTPIVPATGFSNQWQVDLVDQSQTPPASVGQLNLSFNDTNPGGGTINSVIASGGATYDIATGQVGITWLDAGNDLSINIGIPGQAGSISQFSEAFRPINVIRNGAPAGDFARVEIDEAGRLEAIYETGFRRFLYQIPVADVPNPDGLVASDNQSFKISQESGDLFLQDAGDGGTGAIVGFALAESTTDLGTELTDLIRTQRAYASNANVIRTVDEMLQETTNILR
ncbi:flagellar hook-basal body complex protein [Parvularcula sp. ZS-1/3]|uniref:Flagellar hook protein FlgE n=1 Tax=Parvularcula mediterranea TaxID=2732508 RepID=A0A7Y3RJS1_9PROT|nr:flagellar hook-basal body complex protein [Parvularcula mediterranea]NNU15364.1 flagellar hook-basal body complex protein [Parvularcula mediterranea]